MVGTYLDYGFDEISKSEDFHFGGSFGKKYTSHYTVHVALLNSVL